MNHSETLAGQLEAKRSEVKEIFEKHTTDEGLKLPVEVAESVQDRFKEINDLQDAYTKQIEVEQLAEKNGEKLRELNKGVNRLPAAGGGGVMREETPKSIGEAFVESRAFVDGMKANRTNPQITADIADNPGAAINSKGQIVNGATGFKTLMTTATGYAPFTRRSNFIAPMALEIPVIQDFIDEFTTTENSIQYMEETTFTNNAAAVAEGAAVPEAAMGFTLRTVNIEDVGVYLPVTQRQLDDAPQIAAIINQRLAFMVEQKEAEYILTGTGTTPQFRGYLNATNLQTQALGGDNIPDAIYKAMTKIRIGGQAQATGVVLHPNDLQTVRLSKANGLYIWGSPADQSSVMRIWGLPVIDSTGITENTGLVGAFSPHSVMARRQGTTVEIGRINDDFIKGLVCIKIIKRSALIVYRGAAFCTVTGI